MLAPGRMLVSFCSDARSAATSWHRAEVDAELDAAGAALGEELPPELPLELHAPTSSTRPDSKMFRQAWRLILTRFILRERGLQAAGSASHAAGDLAQEGSGGAALSWPAHGSAASVTVAFAE